MARDTECISQAEVVSSPSRDVMVVEILKRRADPARSVNSICNPVDLVMNVLPAWDKGVGCHFSMALGDAIDVVAQVKGEVSQVQDALATEDLMIVKDLIAAQDSFNEVERKLVMS